MLNNLVPFLDTAASRMIGGALTLPATHPAAAALLLAVLAGATAAVWADLLAIGFRGPRKAAPGRPAGTGRR